MERKAYQLEIHPMNLALIMAKSHLQGLMINLNRLPVVQDQ